nr:PBP1A family penicillin-binding protein [Ammoniphilus oxalaticus]
MNSMVPLQKFLRFTRKFFFFGFVVSVIGSLLIGLLILYLRSQPLPPSDIEQTTSIYAEDGQLIDRLFGGQNRTVVELEQIPDHLKQATIAIEDRHFYNHLGFDFKRLGKAVLVDLQHMAKVQGASTISQQLARNLYLTLDKTWERKIKEAILTVQLELNYSKDQLLDLYLNQIYYGHAAYGAQAAAQTYFGKDVSELSLAESAMLAGVPKGPGIYSPYLHLENAKSRQRSVLNAMVEQEYITKEEADLAYAEEIKLVGLVPASEKVIAPYFRDYITQVAKKKYGLSDDQLVHGGLKIYTTLDPVMQQKAEETVAKHIPEDRPLQAALVAMDPQTGAIRAMVGGRDYKESQYNRVFAKRQPGSSFKPFVYLAALENGFTPMTEFKSEPTVFTYGNGQQYTPKNYGNSYANDYITLRTAIAKSDNIYAVKTNMHLGPEQVVETANRIGIHSELQALPSLALGTIPVSPMEMAVGYSTIAAQGEKVEPIAIWKIVDQDGNVLAEEKPKKTRVAEAVPTFLLTDLMLSVFEDGGTGYRVAEQLQRPVAGKTGTTDYDAWLVGFTPQLTLSVWMGYDEGTKMDPVDDSRLTVPLWADFMEQALTDQPPLLFPTPEGVQSVYIDTQNEKLASAHCPTQELVYFAAGTEPLEYCTEHGPADPPAKSPGEGEKKKPFWKRIFNR